MIDGKFKSEQDPFWDRIGVVVARSGVTPNQITIGGTLAMLANCLAYLWHRDPLVFGVLIACLEMSDNLDGAVARVTGTSSAFGAYLDATTDRYKESAILLSIAWVTNAWALCAIGLAGALLTSYAKARAGMERPISNSDWPDLFERLERMVVLCTGLILTPIVPTAWTAGVSPLWVALVLFAVGTHFSALQRVLRARRILEAAP